MDKNELRKSGKLRKAIIFDCDNTLWKGVVGEDIIEPDIDIQADIRFLANHGIIIGLCSRNNESDINEVLKDQFFNDDYISVKRINWHDKPSNLREIAKELNIGLDSIVFVDDSDFEINLMQKELPEILSIYPKELMKIVHEWFDLSGDFGRTRQYKEQYHRRKESEKYSNIDDFLASLDMVLIIRMNDESNIKRIAELTQKTNQFNLTIRRYTESEIKELMDWDKVYSLSVKDRFGDNGLTGVCIVRGTTIDVFLLSCRIIGRDIEYAFMDWIINDLKKGEHKGIIGRYISSDKNKQTEDFYKKSGFEYKGEYGGIVTYSILLSDYKPREAKYFKYE